GASIDIVKDVLSDVKNRGDAALSEYGAKFDVSAPSSLEIPQSELKAAAEKMQRENPELYKAIEYSHDLALRFAKKQRESFDDFEIELTEGVMAAKRHIHATTKDAEEMGLENGEIVSVEIPTANDRSLTFGDVVVRVSDSYALAMHIDTDEANAAGMKPNTIGRVKK
ncbi:MAG: histidinol dehydrogenase, partial [Eubacterium sp.]|nr:histidinol dehydrogenase [Eubacterium sp.]